MVSAYFDETLTQGVSRESLLRVALLIICVAPISVGVGGDVVSANYLFGGWLLFAPRGYRADQTAVIYLCFAVVAWAVGAILFSSGDGDFLIRQAISALVWLVGVLLLFARLP